MILSAQQRRQLLAGSSRGPLRRLMVALDSRAACSQGAATVSGLQRCRNIRIDGHFSAHGIPNARSAFRTTFCVPSYAVMTTSVSCSMSLRGTGGCSGVFGLAPETFSTGLRTSVETVLAPAREGYGGCAGANDGPIAQRISVSRKGTKQPCRSVVGRLLDAFVKGRKRCVRPATFCNARLCSRGGSALGSPRHAAVVS